MTDPFTAECVICGHRPCAPKEDFCAECIEEDRHIDNFGRCYFCRDFHDHESCIGVPCQCPCPTPDQLQRQRQIEAVLEKLTPHERALIGY